MRKLIWLMVLGLSLTSVALTVNAKSRPRQLKKAAQAQERVKKAEREEALFELARQAQQTAERASEQNKALQQQLIEVLRELTQVKQKLDAIDCGLRIADCGLKKTESQLVATPTSAPATTHNPQTDDAQPATRNAQHHLDQVAINTAQIAEQAQTKVESGSRFRVRLFGMILANTFLNSDDSSSNDVPLAAGLPANGPRARRNNLGATLRQSRIGLAMTGPRVGGAKLSAEAEFDFWGDGTGRFDGDVLGSFRVLTALARLDWEKTSVIIGQDQPIISPLSPNSIAAVWYPPLAGAGNLWQWRPQIAVEHRLPLEGRGELIWQGSLMPTFGERVGGTVLEGPPQYETRLGWRRELDSGQTLELGAGAHYGRRQFGFGRNVGGYIVAGDWRIPLGARLELSGEAYHGRSVSLGEQSGGRIDHLFAISGPLDDQRTTISGVRSSGGWLQLSAQARRDLELNFAYGQEDLNNRDLRAGILASATRLKNQVGSANFIYNLTSNFLISFEYRRLWTDYATRRATNNHYSLSFGYLF